MNYISKEEQRYGRNKGTAINRAYINSGEYRKKFDKISDNKKLNKLLYQLAKAMLEHRSGTLYEDMYWVDAETATVVAKETDSCVESEIIYSEATLWKIGKRRGLITIHTHPSGSPPSYADFMSNYVHEYSLGIVCGHNGKVYTYTANEEISEERYESITRKFYKHFHNKELAQMLIIEEVQKQFNIIVKEVK
ncbi:MAG: hypothetical protein J6K04_03885 [Lachnospiraceae bacterium]|nr:hypothetical protein [Lachnospiraceae bacterium]